MRKAEATTATTTDSNRRTVRKAIAIVVAAGATLTAGALAGPALATTARPAGHVTVDSCASVAGTISHTSSPVTAGGNDTALLSATITGCTRYTSPDAGSGTFVANLSTASAGTATSLTGTFTITWPTASGLNPSSGTLGVTGPDEQGAYSVGGSIARGAFTGAAMLTALVFARSDGNEQPVTNTAPLTVVRNNW